jgi:hypothetical protein
MLIDDIAFADMEFFKFGIKLALGLFGVGTILLIFFYLNPSPKIAFTGYTYTVIAVLVSWVYVAILLFNLLMKKISPKNTLRTIGVVLLNIPMGAIYFYIVLILLSHARITFTNKTGFDISYMRIEGCETEEIRNLENGESKTVWIKVSGACKLDIEYEVGGEKRHETVAGHLTNPSGVKATYQVGSNRDIFEEL